MVSLLAGGGLETHLQQYGFSPRVLCETTREIGMAGCPIITSLCFCIPVGCQGTSESCLYLGGIFPLSIVFTIRPVKGSCAIHYHMWPPRYVERTVWWRKRRKKTCTDPTAVPISLLDTGEGRAVRLDSLLRRRWIAFSRSSTPHLVPELEAERQTVPHIYDACEPHI